MEVDKEKVKFLRDSGMSMTAIVAQMNCSYSTIKRVLDKAGYGTVSHAVTKETEKFPILAEEIEQFRNNLQIGETIWLEERDDWNRSQVTEGKYRIVAKYRWFCVARNRRGQERHVLYVDQIIKERGKKLHEEN